MQSTPPFNRALLISIVIGVVLILGVGWILLTGDPGKSPTPPAASPPGFSPVETLTFSSPPPPPRDDTLPTATETGPAAYPAPAETLPSTSTLITETPVTPSATLTPGNIQLLPAGKYDDTDPYIVYDLYWTALKNPSTANAYKGTIHASYDTGSEVSFRFTGKQIRLGYQRGSSFGTVTVLIDDQTYGFNEQAFDLVWSSPKLPPGDHFVRIIHESGESINLDYIVILD